MIVERKAVERYLSEFDEKAKKAYDEYQESGSPSHERKYRKYNTLAEALRTALEYEESRNYDISKRIRNIKHYAESLAGKTYTKDEVYELLLEVAYWR